MEKARNNEPILSPELVAKYNRSVAVKDGWYLSHHTKWVGRPIRAFRQYVFADVIPAFGDIGARAAEVEQQSIVQLTEEYAQEGFRHPNLVAQTAEVNAQGWREMMTHFRQGTINMLAVGLFHLVEQQLGVITRYGKFQSPCEQGANFREIAKWYKQHTGIDFKRLPSRKVVRELYLVANTVKHTDAGGTDELRKLRPELFSNPVQVEVLGATERQLRLAFEADATGASVYSWSQVGDGQRLESPLSGEDFFVTEAILKEYAVGAASFLNEVAVAFDALALAAAK